MNKGQDVSNARFPFTGIKRGSVVDWCSESLGAWTLTLSHKQFFTEAIIMRIIMYSHLFLSQVDLFHVDLIIFKKVFSLPKILEL